jgi:hypothetical protein
MAKFDTKSTFKRLGNKYRLVLMNEDTYEEVAKFRLTRMGVYVALSSLFVTFVGLTVCLIVFTDLKNWLPGIGGGDANQTKQLRLLQVKADKLEKEAKAQERQLEDLKKVLSGNIGTLDTSKLNLPKVEIAEE